MIKTRSTVYLARHGQTEWNLEQRLQGKMNSALTPLGKQQALATQQKLLNKEIHIAYSSPLLRAVETAAIIIAKRPIKLQTRKNLSEISLGPWEGKTYTEIERSHPRQFNNFWHQPHEYQIPGAETYYQLQQRAVAEMQSIAKENPGKNILVISHGIAIKVILANILNKCLSDLGQLRVMKNGDFICLEHQDKRFQLAQNSHKAPCFG